LAGQIDWPPHSLELFIRVVRQNDFKLSATKRTKHFCPDDGRKRPASRASSSEHFQRTSKRTKSSSFESHVKRVLRFEAEAYEYRRAHQPRRKLGPVLATLEGWLETEAMLPVREQRTAQRLYEALCLEGYTGAVDAVQRNVRVFERRRHPNSTAFIPQIFASGEAYQFDWTRALIRELTQRNLTYTRGVIDHINAEKALSYVATGIDTGCGLLHRKFPDVVGFPPGTVLRSVALERDGPPVLVSSNDQTVPDLCETFIGELERQEGKNFALFARLGQTSSYLLLLPRTSPKVDSTK
jgi:hypothetical protein